MKRKILYSCLSLLVVFSLVFFVVPPQAISLEETEVGCSSLAAGKKATVDGSVLFGHNEDDSACPTLMFLVPRKKHELGEIITFWDTGATIPQVVGETWAYIWSYMPGFKFSDSYLNEWGVSIASDACFSKEVTPYDLTNGGIGYWLRRLVPERAKTAREGVQIMGEMVETLGYIASGRTYIVADPKEAWFVSVVAGKHWVAQRVPDKEVAFIPNRYTIHEVDLDDTENFLACPDLIEHAIEKGWYDPHSGEPFDFAKVYAGVTGSDRRQRIALKILTGKDYSENDRAPFSVKPIHNLSIKDIGEVLKGTEGSGTQESFVMQLRTNMPSAIGNVYWRSQCQSGKSVFVPWYLGILEVPHPYSVGKSYQKDAQKYAPEYYDPNAANDMNSAYWAFHKLTVLVNNEDKRKVVRDFWDNVEAIEFALQDEIEKTALKIYEGKDYHGILGGDEYLARWFLTRYTESLALNAYYNALGFIEYFE